MAAQARLVLARLAGDLPAALLEDLRLLVSELVTNSFRHAGLGAKGIVLLSVDVESGRVHVEVEDPGKGFTLRPLPRRPLERESGWGFTIVDRLADRWGVDQNGSTVVWFDLRMKHERARPEVAKASMANRDAR